MLVSVTLRNWKTHRETTIRFAEGTNLIIGVMGSGKSSILDAICFAFFGTFPGLKKRTVKLADVQNFYLDDDSEISAEFMIGKDRFIAKRTITKGKGDGFLYANGKLVEKASKRVTEYICRLLDTDYELFTRAIYSEQNKIDSILNLDPASRKRQIDELLGIDKFERARKNSLSMANKLRSTAEELKSQASRQDIEEIGQVIAKTEAETNELKANREKLAAENRELKEKALAAKKSYEQIKVDYEKKQAIESKIGQLKGALKALESRFEKQKDYEKEITECRKELAEIEESSGKTNSETKEAREKVLVTEKKKSVIEQRIKASEKAGAEATALEKELTGIKPDELEKTIELKSSESRKALEQASSLEAESNEAKKALDSMKPGMTNCPVCSRPMDKHTSKEIEEEKKRIIANAANRIAELAKQRKELESLVKELREKQRKSEKLGARIGELRKQLVGKESKKELEELAGTIAEARKELGGLEEKGKELMKKRNSLANLLNGLVSSSKASAEHSRAESESKKLELEAGNFKVTKKDYEDSFEKYKEELLRAKESESNVKLCDEKINGAELRLAESRKEIERIRKLIERGTKYEEAARKLNSFKDCLTAAQILLRTRVIEALNMAMNEVWKNLYPYGDIDEVKVEASGNDYQFLAMKKDFIDVGMLSGGERSCVALAFRVALASVLAPKLNMIFLDEPTHNLDEEAIKTLAILLEEKIPSVIGQAIVITHEKELIRPAFSSISYLRRDKEKDGFTEVGE